MHSLFKSSLMLVKLEVIDSIPFSVPFLRFTKKFYTIITAEIVTVVLTKLRRCISFTKTLQKAGNLIERHRSFLRFHKN